MEKDSISPRTCLRDPIPEIFEAAFHLDAAVSAHLARRQTEAAELIRRADVPAIGKWTDSLWGSGGPWSKGKKSSTILAKDLRTKTRMPTTAEKQALLSRDGFRCRFCGIPLVRAEIRKLIGNSYPEALRWNPNVDKEQHTAFQAMRLQYDHLIPHARGGTSEPDNMVITCAPCNYGRGDLTLEEVGVADPRKRSPLHATWDGLERFAAKRA